MENLCSFSRDIDPDTGYPKMIEIKVEAMKFFYHPAEMSMLCNHFMSDWGDELTDLFVNRETDDHNPLQLEFCGADMKGNHRGYTMP